MSALLWIVFALFVMSIIVVVLLDHELSGFIACCLFLFFVGVVVGVGLSLWVIT